MAAMASKVTETVTAKDATRKTVEAATTTSVSATAWVEAATTTSAATTSVSATSVSAVTVLGRCNSRGKSDRCTDCGRGGNADERFSEHGSVSGDVPDWGVV